MYSPPSQKRTATPNGIIVSARANYGQGNRVAAMEHIRRAIQMEPDNPDYQRFYQIVQSGGRMYTNTGSRYGFSSNSNFCYPMCMAWGVYVIPASVVGITGSVVKEAFL